MEYEARYRAMQDAVTKFYSAKNALKGSSQRLNTVKNTLGLFQVLAGYRASINSRAVAASNMSDKFAGFGQCLDNARMEYILGEQGAYQLISGDRSFNGQGVAPTPVPPPPSTGRPSWWDVLVNFMSSQKPNTGAIIGGILYPPIPWWMFKFIRGKMNPGSGAKPGGGVTGGEPPAENPPTETAPVPPEETLDALAKQNPVRAGSKLNSKYGMRKDPINGAQKMHTGIDLGPVPHGTKPNIHPYMSGTIVEAKWSDSYGYYVKIKHADGSTSLYAHLDSLNVNKDDEVTLDTVIGVMGTTGRSTGVHLHFEVKDSGGNFIDPAPLIGL